MGLGESQGDAARIWRDASPLHAVGRGRPSVESLCRAWVAGGRDDLERQLPRIGPVAAKIWFNERNLVPDVKIPPGGDLKTDYRDKVGNVRISQSPGPFYCKAWRPFYRMPGLLGAAVSPLICPQFPCDVMCIVLRRGGG